MERRLERTVNVLGTKYTLREATLDDEPVKLADKEGYAELYAKELIIRTGYEDVPGTVKNVNAFKQSLLRHEMFHAVFHECGLSQYCNDETLVDFLAIQFPKLVKVMKQAEDIYVTN